MLILGIETSCDDTGVALVEVNKKGTPRVLLNFMSSQVKIHSRYGGVVPYLAAREHERNLPLLIGRILKEYRQLTVADLIVVTIGPGLAPSLLIGTTAAKLLSYFWQKTIIGVSHLEGHLFSPFLNEIFKRPLLKFPFLCLLVSGGHTELVVVRGIGEYSVLGRTLDDACGEAFDKVARLLGLAYPGGPKIEKLAQNYASHLNEKLLFKPPMINSGDFNFSYSGLKTAVLYKIKSDKSKSRLKPKSDYIAWHFQEAALRPLVKKTLLAAKNFQIRSIIVAGGVSNNNRLKQLFEHQIRQDHIDAQVFFPDKILTQDNAAMIAYAGYLNYIRRGEKGDSLDKIQSNPNLDLGGA